MNVVRMLLGSSCRRVLEKRAKWCAEARLTSDEEFVKSHSMGEHSDTALAIRRALARRCGVNKDLLSPQDDLDEVASIMGSFDRLTWNTWLREPFPGEFDCEEFLMDLEKELKISIPNQCSLFWRMPRFSSQSSRRSRKRVQLTDHRGDPDNTLGAWVGATARLIEETKRGR